MEEEAFNKKEWILEYKKYSREFITEFTSRFKPLILFKKDFTSFIDDANREATKSESKYQKIKSNKIKEINDIKGKSVGLSNLINFRKSGKG
jgi:hypothetical protein